MGKNRPRFITGPDAECGYRELGVGANHALGLMSPSDEGLILTFYAKANLDAVSPRLATVFGERVVDRLWASRHAGPLRVLTERGSLPFSWHGPVLMVYPSAKLLSAVGEMRDVTAEIVVPFSAGREEITNWVNAWTPTPIGAAVAQISSVRLSHTCTVALQWLTSFVNFNNRLTGTDREEAVHTFETLVAFDPALDAAAVRAWLVGVGKWPGDMADRAVEILDDLTAGKQIRGRKGPNKGLYERWSREGSDGTS